MPKDLFDTIKLQDIFDKVHLDIFDKVELSTEDKILYSEQLIDAIREQLKAENAKIPIGEIIAHILEKEFKKQKQANETIEFSITNELEKTKAEVQNEVKKLKESEEELEEKLKQKYADLRNQILSGQGLPQVVGGYVLTVEEEDGVPRGQPTRLKFPNGTITDNNDGSFSVSSGSNEAPNDATYVTLSTNATLTNERVLTGAVNQIAVTDNGAGSTVVLSTPQDIHTGASPTFTGLTLSGLTANRALASNASKALVSSAVTDTELGYLSGVTSAIQTQLNNKQPLDPTLTALAAYNTNGLLTQTAADTFTGRTIAGTTNQVNVANGDGVSGNPTLSLPQDIHTGASPTFVRATLSQTTGTAPLTVSSATVVTNLNADLLDGLNGSDLALSNLAFVTIGNTGSLSAERALTGTANQITITDNGVNSTVVLSTPQNIHTAATPTFSGLTLSALTAGRVLVTDTGGLLATDAGLTYSIANDTLSVLGSANSQRLIIKANGTQTTNLFEAQNSSSAVKAHINSGGEFENEVIFGTTNSAFGKSALQSATALSSANQAFGFEAAKSLTDGTFNIAIGFRALKSLTTATSSTAIGTLALELATGEYCTGICAAALSLLTTGSYDTAIGPFAGAGTANGGVALTTGTFCTLIGPFTDTKSADAFGAVTLGYEAIAAGGELGISPYVDLVGLYGKSSTSATRERAAIDLAWVDDTDASRKARVIISAYDTAKREGIRIEGGGSAVKLGFFGANAVVKPSAYTPTNVTTDRSYDANSTTLDEIADVLGTLIADLQSLGLIG